MFKGRIHFWVVSTQIPVLAWFGITQRIIYVVMLKVTLGWYVPTMSLFIVVIIHDLVIGKEVGAFDSSEGLDFSGTCTYDILDIETNVLWCVFFGNIWLFYKFLIIFIERLSGMVLGAVKSSVFLEGLVAFLWDGSVHVLMDWRASYSLMASDWIDYTKIFMCYLLWNARKLPLIWLINWDEWMQTLFLLIYTDIFRAFIQFILVKSLVVQFALRFSEMNLAL